MLARKLRHASGYDSAYDCAKYCTGSYIPELIGSRLEKFNR